MHDATGAGAFTRSATVTIVSRPISFPVQRVPAGGDLCGGGGDTNYNTTLRQEMCLTDNVHVELSWVLNGCQLAKNFSNTELLRHQEKIKV